jgi:hypothetical protein
VPLGLLRVEINSPRVVGQRKAFDTPDSPVQNVYEESVPAQFNAQSTLTREIKAGNSVEDFDLKSAE